MEDAIKDSGMKSGAFDFSTIDEDDMFSFLNVAGKMFTSYACDTWGPVFSQSFEYEDFTLQQLNDIAQKLSTEENDLTERKKEIIKKFEVISQNLLFKHGSK